MYLPGKVAHQGTFLIKTKQKTQENANFIYEEWYALRPSDAEGDVKMTKSYNSR